jgi:hypothetical protein
VKRIYHPYTKWEEVAAGMWNKYNSRIEESMYYTAKAFTADAKLYGQWMLKVLDAWPFSCEQNLSCGGMNRQAWIGHAAVCLAHGIPEHVTRLAWWTLTTQQQDEANAEADKAILIWESRYNGKN